eukprot:9127454-Pyramimonas_sp.AAC.1
MSGPTILSTTNTHHRVWLACAQHAIRHQPRRPCQQQLDTDRGVAVYDPNLAARCMLYGFDRDGGPHGHDSKLGPEVYFVLVFGSGDCGGPHR